MIIEHYVLDTPTLLALGCHKQVSGLIHVAAGDSTVRLWVPIACALEAERERAGLVGYLGILDVLHTLDADYATAHAVADLYRRGMPYGIAAAAHSVRPTLDRPDGALVATITPAVYDNLSTPFVDLNQ
ncbi:hypothetical protein [Streptomyces fractus]|uniref:hypothetical protein n=1 Tax=Streptomyces fractus TaxID=641806 RepID=UPI003CF265E0